MPADMRVSITNSLNEGGYPITGFTWILVYQHPLRASQVRNFLQWVVTTGQAYTAGVQYAGVPEKALLAVHRIVNSIH
jgi:phosphate transport system substrate-binding protein